MSLSLRNNFELERPPRQAFLGHRAGSAFSGSGIGADQPVGASVRPSCARVRQTIWRRAAHCRDGNVDWQRFLSRYRHQSLPQEQRSARTRPGTTNVCSQDIFIWAGVRLVSVGPRGYGSWLVDYDLPSSRFGLGLGALICRSSPLPKIGFES
jgi:hypothetical protein